MASFLFCMPGEQLNAMVPLVFIVQTTPAPAPAPAPAPDDHQTLSS